MLLFIIIVIIRHKLYSSMEHKNKCNYVIIFHINHYCFFFTDNFCNQTFFLNIVWWYLPSFLINLNHKKNNLNVFVNDKSLSLNILRLFANIKKTVRIIFGDINTKL